MRQDLTSEVRREPWYKISELGLIDNMRIIDTMNCARSFGNRYAWIEDLRVLLHNVVLVKIRHSELNYAIFIDVDPSGLQIKTH